MKMDISEIKDLINAISNSKIDIFDYEENGAKLHLERQKLKLLLHQNL